MRTANRPGKLNAMRKQYHLRNSEKGLLAWDVHRLIKCTSGLPPFEFPISAIRELDEAFWASDTGEMPTCRQIAEHARLMNEADLGHPIILDPDNRVMDGMHRVCKALNEGRQTIRAVRLPVLVEPDYVGVPAGELPY